MKLTIGKKLSLLVVFILIVDQVVKIWIKMNMTIGESISVFGSWFQIYFIENNGMAFGMQLGGDIGKFLLTFLRLLLSAGMIFYIRKLIAKKAPLGVLIGVSLILIGALGNIIDSMFYGILFSESTYTQVAQFLPEGGGYAPFFFGRVVDMLYFPVIHTTLPNWIPFVGGNDFLFFRPIFNIADSAITIGVFYLIIFQRKYFLHSK